MHAPQPIRRQLNVLLLATSLPFVIFLSASEFVHARQARENAGRDMLAVARVTAARLDDHVGDITQVLSLLSDVVGVDPSETQRNDALLTALAPQLPPHINNVTVFSVDGRNLGSLDPRMRSAVVELKSRTFHSQALARPGLSVQAPFKSTLNGEAVAVFALRIERQGRVVGVVSMSTQLRHLQTLLAPAGSLPAGALVTVVGDDGVILARSIDPEKWIGRNLKTLPSGFVENQLRREGVREAASADGVLRVAGFSTARRVPWLVYVGVPVSEALEATRVQLLENLAVGAAMLLTGFLLSMRIARRISSPLRLLQAHAQALEAGDLSRRTPVRGSGEIMALSHTLNLMAEALQQRTGLLESSQRELVDLYDNAPCGYHSLDATGLYLRINDTELSWLGLTRDEVVGRRRLAEFLTPEGRELFALRFARLRSEGRLDDVELEIVPATGAPRRVVASASVLHDASGAFEMTRMVLHDITERRNAEQARLLSLGLEMENRRLRDAAQFKSLFLGSMSHELRTPLNAVVGFTHLLQTGLVPQGTQEYDNHLDKVSQAARALQQLIDSLLEFANESMQEIDLHPEPVDLSDVVRTVVDSLGETARSLRVDIATEIDPALGEVIADPLRLGQVLSSLVSNAVKFSRPGGLVRIRVGPEGAAQWRIDVQDNGIGIAEADQARIFKAFQQAGEGGRRAGAGASIGLALSRKLAELQGGRIGVVSRLAFGSTFYLVLPLAPGRPVDPA